jgi:phospholipid/cholesterol/gamma-HCH transport system substrate-binding protein
VKRAIRDHSKDFGAIVALIVVALGVSYYIVQNQRLRIPFLEPKPYTLNAEFTTGQAVIAGQGQTVRVSGVRVGDIGAVKLKDGRAVIRMDLDQDYKTLVHTDATALLRPKTGLKDMFIDLDPGTASAPLAKAGWTIPVQATQPDVNPDEVLGTLDADTRDYLKLLIQGAGRGLEGRSADLRDVFARFEPTHRDLARVNGAVAERRQNLRRLIHSLRLLNTALASQPDQLAGLVNSSEAVLRQFASEQASISRAVGDLPGTLRQTTSTLGKVQSFADVLGPAARKLRPAARTLDTANKATIPFAKEITPVLRERIRPFVREARPVVRDLKAPAARLAKATPDLTGTFTSLNHLFNLLAYNPKGAEPPEVGADRQEGYLFWLAWLNHMALNLFSSADAHGTFRPTTAAGTCNTFKAMAAENPEIKFLQGLTPLLVDACGEAYGTPIQSTKTGAKR